MHTGVRTAFTTEEVSRTVLEKLAIEGESPVRENLSRGAVSRVPRYTRNLVGKSGDHPVRLNTT